MTRQKLIPLLVLTVLIAFVGAVVILLVKVIGHLLLITAGVLIVLYCLHYFNPTTPRRNPFR